MSPKPSHQLARPLPSRYHKKPMYNDVALLTVAEPPIAPRGSCCSIARKSSQADRRGRHFWIDPMRGCFLSSAVLVALLHAIPAQAQSATDLLVLQGLVPVSTLLGDAAGKAALTANFEITAAIQDGNAKQPLLLSFPEQQQQALRDAFITDGNAYELADGLGTSLGRAYQSVATFDSSDDGMTSSFKSLSPAVASLIAYTNGITKSARI